MMLCDTEREPLLAALQAVVGIVERRHALPVLGHVHLRKTGRTLTLTTSDLERQVSTAAELGGDAGEFAVTVGAHKLLEILRALPARQRLRLTAGPGRLTLRSGSSRFTLQTRPAEDFPATPAPPDGALALSLPRRVLGRLIEQVAFAMAVQDIRYFFNGLLFSVDVGRLTLVGTDGNRLAVAHAAVETAGPGVDVIVPRKTVLELQRLLRADPGGDGGDVTLLLSASQVRLHCAGVQLVSNVIEGRFPDYRRVLPQGHPHGVTLDRAAWLAGVQRAVILAGEKFRGICISLPPGALRMVAGNAEQEEACEELPADHDGIELEIGLNAAYLIDLLDSTGADTVHMALRDAHSSVLFTLPSQPDFAYVVGPMRI
jgi:DNA polymerase-3 subunit beta